MTLFNLSSGNSLIRRVRRHRVVSALFRHGTQLPAPNTIQQETEASAGPASESTPEIVQAEMTSVRRIETPSSPKPEGATPAAHRRAASSSRAGPSPPSTQADQQVDAESSAVSTSAERTPKRPVESEEIATRASAGPDTQPAIDAVSSQDADDEESTITETVWERLKTIFQRHQAPTDEPTSSPEVGPDPEPAAAPPAESSLEKAQRSVPSQKPEEPSTATSAEAEPTTVQRQPSASGDEERAGPVDIPPPVEATAQPPPTDDEDTALKVRRPEGQTAPPAARSAEISPPVRDSQPRSVETETTSVTASETVTEARPISGSEIVEGPEMVEAERPPTREPEVVDRPAPSTERPEERETDRTSADTTEADVQAARASPSDRPPLQEVWEVQTTAQQPETQPQPRTSASRETPVETTAVPHIQQVMRRTTSERPTRSSIEVIQPRRPRPSTPPSERPGSQEDAELPPTVPEDAGARAVARSAAGERGPRAESTRPEPDKLPASHVPDVEETISDATEQAQRTPASSALPEGTEPGMVQTEIGPLPGDLWALIGESPPTSEAVPAPQAEEAEHPVAEATSQATPGPPNTVSKRETIVQRAETRTDEAPNAQAERGRESEEGIDIDELARRVYGEVRRRLTVELERMRSHF